MATSVQLAWEEQPAEWEELTAPLHLRMATSVPAAWEEQPAEWEEQPAVWGSAAAAQPAAWGSAVASQKHHALAMLLL